MNMITENNCILIGPVQDERKVNKMRYFTVIADLNVKQKKI